MCCAKAADLTSLCISSTQCFLIHRHKPLPIPHILKQLIACKCSSSRHGEYVRYGTAVVDQPQCPAPGACPQELPLRIQVECNLVWCRLRTARCAIYRYTTCHRTPPFFKATGKRSKCAGLPLVEGPSGLDTSCAALIDAKVGGSSLLLCSRLVPGQLDRHKLAFRS